MGVQFLRLWHSLQEINSHNGKKNATCREKTLAVYISVQCTIVC